MHMLTLERRWQVRTAVVMPYHVHLFVSLGDHAEPSAAVETFKHRLAPCLEPAGLHWEDGYFDRRINPGEDPLPLFLYIFQNPYEAQLIAPDESWPGYFCTGGDWSWFAPLRCTRCQFPAWLVQWRLYAVTPAPASPQRSA